MQETQNHFTNPFGEMPVRSWEDENFHAGLYSFQGIFRLTIHRESGNTTPMSWEELQSVKSACGFGGLDALEVYPRDIDVVNTGNARHLYIMPEPVYFAVRNKPPVLQASNPPENGVK